MTLLITGAYGQVGRELVSEARRQGVPHEAVGKCDVDITDPEAVRRFIGSFEVRPAIVVNLAAFTDVDSAETIPEHAFEVNVRGVENLGRTCAVFGLPLIHISTDYVFGGGAKDFQEDDRTDPLNAYGRSKEAGEETLRKALPEHLILRTSWVFGTSGKNFVKTMLRLAQETNEVRVVKDEIGCPTGARDVALTILRLAEHITESEFRDWGTYHFCGRPPVSRAEFARAVLSGSKKGGRHIPCHVREISSADYASAVRRPSRSVLDCTKIKRVFGIEQPDWMPNLLMALSELVGEYSSTPSTR